jgi:hypothetical protein
MNEDTGIVLRTFARISPAGRGTDRTIRMPGTVMVVMKCSDTYSENEKQGKKKYCLIEMQL